MFFLRTAPTAICYHSSCRFDPCEKISVTEHEKFTVQLKHGDGFNDIKGNE